MKIKKINVYVLKSQLDQSFAASQGWIHQRGATIVEVITDEGIVGWGEALCQGMQYPEISAITIKKSLEPLLIGRSPLDTEVLWDEMYYMTRDYGRKGAIIGAISAIDIALWDIKGKYYNQPVYQLLGGLFREKVEAYATGFFRLEGQNEKERLVDEALNHLESGFRLMKVKLGFGIDDDIKVFESIYDAVGDKAELMVDLNHAYGVADVVRLGRALEKYPLRWIEEPVIPEDVEGYVEVRRKIDIPIAGGENEYTAYGFKDLLNKRAIDIAQPDICITGGFTAGHHINQIARVNGVEVNPHVWGTAIGQYASLHYIASIPLTNRSMFAKEPIFEYDRSSHPFRVELVENPLPHENGWLSVPDSPGIGVVINKEFLERNAEIYE